MSYSGDARSRITGGQGGTRTVSASNGYGHDFSGPQRRGGHRGRGNWRKRGGGGGGGGYGQRGVNPRSRLEQAEDAEGDAFMGEVSPPQRFAPYQRGRRGQRQVNTVNSRADSDVRSRLGHPGPTSQQGGRRGSQSGWNKVIIPNGAQHHQDWLLRQLQSNMSEVLTPEEFHCYGETAAFFVQNQRAVQELKKVSHKIRTRDGSTLAVFVKPSAAPQNRDAPFSRMRPHPGGEGIGPSGSVTLTEQMTPQQEDILKLALGNRFDITTNSLNLSDLFHDEVLEANGIRAILSHTDLLDGVLRVIHDSCPELVSLDLGNNRLTTLDGCIGIGEKLPNLHLLGLANNVLRSDAELDKLKGCPKLVALSLEGNPFVSQLSGSYSSAVQRRLPNVTSLDGQQIAPKIGFDLPIRTALPEIKSSFAVNPQIKQLVYKFLETYYNLYDSPGGREKLLDAYTDDALFSLAVGSVQTKQPHKGPPTTEYLHHSRNLLRVKHGEKKNELIRRGRLQIASLIDKLPSTKHDFGTFTVDIALSLATCTCFTVWGLFQETTFGTRPIVRCFSRVFVCIPSALGSNLAIVNDELHIRNATASQMKAFDQSLVVASTPFDQTSASARAPTGLVTPGLVSPTGLPTVEQKPWPLMPSGAMAGLNAQQQEMVVQFSKESGMNLEWSQKCLAQNNWVYLQSAQAFTVLQSNSSIPPEAFVKH